ncbi:MAG: hypothetical protein JWO19_954 [Bryobacterales bacterium]|nr:hypothetical protein [Bryobacterales bacterium]
MNFHKRNSYVLSMKKLTCMLVVATGAAFSAFAAEPDSPASDLATLKALITQQQQQIDQLRQTLQEQSQLLEVLAGREAQPVRSAEIASLAPILPSVTAAVASPGPQAPPNPTQAASDLAPRIDSLQKAIDSINANLRGFRFSGDFRYRFDLGLRSGNSFAGPLQNARARYRVRLNVDKDLAPGLSSHLQLSTGPYVTQTTNDQDFAGVAVKHPFSIAEAWIQYKKKNFTTRGGRMEEVFADNMRLLWDDDVRLNGFEARYKVGLSKTTSLEFRAGEYILTNPNTPIVAPGSPFLAAGYRVGQKLRDTTLLHPGFILRTQTGKWTYQLYGTYSWYRNADQIQLASTAAGPAVVINPAIGLMLSGPLTASGNAVTTPGGAMLAARHWEIPHGGLRIDYADFKIGNRPMPFWTDLQGSINAGTGSDRSAFMATANLGAINKFGDVRFVYQFARKEANSMISQLTDDDLGTGTGVNIRVNAVRFDVGLTRFLQWQNLLFIQDPIEGNRPGFFVTLPKGSNTTYRYLGQLAFTF